MSENSQEEMRADPETIFESPQSIVEDDSISKEEKITILKQWLYDVRELAVAEEENMGADENRSAKRFEEIHKALNELGVLLDND